MMELKQTNTEAYHMVFHDSYMLLPELWASPSPILPHLHLFSKCVDFAHV